MTTVEKERPCYSYRPAEFETWQLIPSLRAKVRRHFRSYAVAGIVFSFTHYKLDLDVVEVCCMIITVVQYADRFVSHSYPGVAKMSIQNESNETNQLPFSYFASHLIKDFGQDTSAVL